MYLLVAYKGYGFTPCFARGPVEEIALHLAKVARRKCKGRMRDSAVRSYADMFEEILRKEAEVEETREVVLTADAMPFEVGVNVGRSQRVKVPVTVHDIYDEDTPFGWRPCDGWSKRSGHEKTMWSNELYKD